MPGKLILAAAVFLVALSARAAPPANADPRMAPWFDSLVTKWGWKCCGQETDCRPVEALSPLNSPDHKHWWAFIGRDQFGEDAPNRFIMVPDTALQIDTSDLFRPPGAVACYLTRDLPESFVGGKAGTIVCFRPPRTAG